MKAYRSRFGLQNLCEVHHVIPRACKRHPALTHLGFDVEDPGNFALLPSYEGARVLALRARLVHAGGHMRYNAYVWSVLDTVDDDEALCEVLRTLHRRVRRDPTTPWN